VARKRPTASDVTQPALTCLDGGRCETDAQPITRAEAEAARRTAAVTHSRLEQQLRAAPDPPSIVA
jgi:hypothetical protein